MRRPMAVLSPLMLALPAMLAAQATQFDPSRTTTTLRISVGYGGASSDWFQNLYDYGGTATTPRADLGGWSATFGLLRRVTSRVELGGEVGLYVIGPGSLRSINYGIFTCSGSGCAGSPTDDAGIHVGALASVRTFEVGKLIVRAEGGGGLNFFNLNAAGPAASRNASIRDATGTPYYQSAPGAEPYLVGRLVTSIVLMGNGGTGLTLDPYVSLLKTTGTTAVQSLTFGGAFSIHIGSKD